ncbi:translocation/assembly module TamB domain-containing protein [Pedobacter sp. P351]|uniref:translocation/assembly module TamB domain-containing protein n=1 Tax=Pedobacter superstes TaxID=3133441 RepID=UPI0030982B17
MGRFGTISLKILLGIIGFIILLFILIFILIRVPAVQNFARGKAVNYLEGKLGTKVEVKRLSLNLPKLVVLEDVYFEDQKGDTLLAGDTLKVDISLLKLLKNTVEINEIDLRGVTLNVNRGADSVFNFDYIVKAFATQAASPQPVDTTAAAMKFSVDKINLDRIRLKYQDAPTANDVSLYLSHFDTRVKEFDMEKMRFNIPKFKLSGVNAVIIQSKPAIKSDSKQKDMVEAATPLDLDLVLGAAEIDRVKVKYRNDVSALNADMDIGNLDIESDKLDMKKQNIDLKSIKLDNSMFNITLGTKPQAQVVVKEVKEKAEAVATFWGFSADDIQLTNTQLRYNDQNLPVQRRGMDYGHLDIKNLNLDANNFLFAKDTISGKINSGNFTEKSGFQLRRLRTTFFYGNNKTTLEDLYLETDKTLIRNDIKLAYSSIEDISKNPGDLRIDADLDNTRLGLRDVLVFMPDLASTEPFKSNSAEVLHINGSVNGQVKNLSISGLEVSGYRNTNLRASGRITGLPDMNKAYFDLDIDRFTTRSSDIYSFVPAGTIPSNIRIPEALSMNGTFKGSMTRFSTNLNLNSSFGSAKTIGTFSFGKVPAYNARINTYNFNVGRMIKQEATIGRITMGMNVNGSGMDAKTFSGTVNGKVIRAEYNKYNYRNLTLSANAKNGAITAKAFMTDPNIDFDLNARANFRNKYPKIQATLDIDSLNLQKLHFSPDDFRFRGKIVADLETADPDYLNGEILLTNALMVTQGKRIDLDSVSAVSTANADSNTLKVRSEFLSANASGKYKLTEIGPAIQSTLNRYYNPNGATVITRASGPAQYMKFDARLENNPLVQQFVPEIKEMSTISLAGNFNNQTGALTVNGTAPRLVYGTYDLNNLAFNISPDANGNTLTYSVALNKFGSAQFQILNTSLTGTIQNNIISTDFQVKDARNRQRYRIAGNLRAMKANFEFSLLPDGLILNYDPWIVGQNNAIQFGSSGILARNFTLSNSNQLISINSQPMGLNNPMSVDFKNFRIETLTEMARKDSLLAGGTINGNALIRNFQTSPIFTSDLTVSDFNFRGDTIGNIAMKVNNERANTLAANIGITGKGNQVNMNGYYYINNSSFDMTLDIGTLNLQSIQGFTMGNMKDASGNLSGRLAITGTAEAPRINGDVNFNDAAFRIGMFNSLYRVDDERISFNDSGINFNNFTLLDSAGNTANIDGMVYTKNFLDYNFNLDVNSDNFQVLNSTAKDNELYYGQLFVDSRIRIRGSMINPEVDADLKVLDNTRLTVLLPQTNPGVVEREGIVEFVDMDDPEVSTVFTTGLDSLNTAPLTGYNVASTIEISKEAEFNLIVDQGNGDFIKVKGQAQLTGGIDPSGKVTLIGNYILEEGAYELSFNFIKRKFDIQKGSTITWNGEPTSGDMDVTAIYVAETAPIDLVQSQLAGASQATLNTYKQRLPFQLLLKLKGELMKPQISFDIELPEGNYFVSGDVISTVNTRLDQLREEPSELNKQAFALVLLNRFVAENPFESNAGGTSAESLARQSVSKLLTEQLNNLAGGLIGGVDLSFNLEATDDYTSGELKNRTDLNVAASKRLLNDRLKVSIGSNFELEGPQRAGQRTNNIAGDIAVDYQLSKDGRYLLRAYRKDQYLVAVEGQVIETGLSFILNMDYNKFQEIFKSRTKEDKQLREAQKTAEKEATK